MSTLLERQIRKFLPQDLADNESLKPFLEAVKKSYHTQEEQFNMLQRAMQISSEELFVANQKLREESKAQQEILDSLKLVIKSLQLKAPQKNENLDVIELANYLKEQSEELNKVREEQETFLKSLENKNEILSNYAHMVSHDLKSPLRNINTLLNFILEEKPELASQCKEYISLILNNLEKMDALINGILNYSTLDKEQFGKEVIDLNLLLTQLTEVIYIPEHIELQVPKNFPTIYGDTVRVQQIFQNILQNAINSIEKEKGLIKIDYKDRENFWEFSIKDNGYGIPQHQFEKIFRIFEKIDNDQQATGIGLSIVKKIIDFYDGKIWLESELDKGTTFYFTLPK